MSRTSSASAVSAATAIEQARRLFRQVFGTEPATGASAPGRVNLIGEHIDYNGGPVLPVAVDRRTAVVAAPADSWEMTSATDGQVLRREPDDPMGAGWTDYVAGVVRELREIGAAPAGARLAIGSTLPIGAGLSSSAALTVAVAHCLARLTGRTLAAAELADLAYRAEHDRVGVRCGRMDQTIAAFAEPGHALLFETATGALRSTPFPGTYWIVETGVSHKLTGGALNARRRECEEALALCRPRWPELCHLADLPPDALPDAMRLLPAPLDRRVRHVVTETARTRRAAAALAAGDLAAVGALLVEGHASLRDDYESTIPEADLVADSAVRHGAWGARLTGAGWGGALVLLAPEDAGAAIVERVARDFAARYGRVPESWRSHAAGGVRAEGFSKREP